MLTLASLLWALWGFSAAELHMAKHTPLMPVAIVEEHRGFDYVDIESAIYVPYPYNDSCYSQQQLALQMLKHFNNYRNGRQKFTVEQLDRISRKWVCLTDDK